MLDDPVERLKLLMTQQISYFYKEKIYEKPLNPILGETFQARGQDGAMIYMEQTSHHPPISHFLIEGPDNSYNMKGWSQYDIRSGLTGARVNVSGTKTLTFHDGQAINFNATNDYIFNIFMGTMGHQLTGTLWFKDEQNGLHGEIRLGSFKKKT